MGFSVQFCSLLPQVKKAGSRCEMGHDTANVASHRAASAGNPLFRVPSEATASKRHLPMFQTLHKHRLTWIKSKAEVRIGLSP